MPEESPSAGRWLSQGSVWTAGPSVDGPLDVLGVTCGGDVLTGHGRCLARRGHSTTPIPDPPRVLPAEVAHALASPSGWFGSWWMVVAIAVVAVVLATVAVRHVRRRRRWWPTATAAVMVLALAAGAGMNAYSGYVPSETPRSGSCSQVRASAKGGQRRSGDPSIAGPTGAIHAVTIPTPSTLGLSPSTTWIYTPPGYAPSTSRYPVVYLIGGEPGTSADWLAGGSAAHTMDVLISAGLMPPSDTRDAGRQRRRRRRHRVPRLGHGGAQVESYLIHVVVPWVDSHLATKVDPEHRVIGGMSAGGFCAVDQGLRHQDVFSTILGIMPYVEPGDAGRDMLTSPAEYAQRDVAAYLPALDLPRPVAVFIDVPGDDLGSSEAAEAATLVGLLQARGEPIEYRIEPHQGHAWTMAAGRSPYALTFAAMHMPTG